MATFISENNSQKLIITKNRFQLYSTQTPDSDDIDITSPSDYEVVLGKLIRRNDVDSFSIEVFKGKQKILGSIGNWGYYKNSENLLEPFLVEDFNYGTSSTNFLNRNQQSNFTLTLKNTINIDNSDHDCIFSYSCFFREINDRAQPPNYRYLVENLKLTINLKGNNSIQTNPNSTNSSLLNSINNKLKDNNLNVFMEFQTDKKGLNLGEMYCQIDSDKKYPNGYPQKYIGTCVGYKIPKNTAIKNTFYSFKPNLQKVLKLSGKVLYEQTKNINNKYNTGLNDCQFYYNILSYSTLRYMCGGLSNCSVFSTKWLCSNNYDKFLINLENSEFSEAVSLFTEPQPEFDFDFSNYKKYYRKCKCRK